MPETSCLVGEAAHGSGNVESAVKWEVEDPSEFRPGLVDNIGKEVENFRIFDVRKTR